MSSSPTSPTFLSRFLPAFLFVLAAVGVPAATITVFTHFVTEHPLLALGLGLLYEMVVFVFGFLGQIWQGLERRWVERIAEWIDHRVQVLISRYRKLYCQYLCYQHRDFDMKGLSTLGIYTMELDQVFVELRIDPTTPQRTTASPVQVPQSLLEGRNFIWDYLISFQLRKQHFVIIGPPGSGKTTLLKRIALTLASQERSHHRSHQVKALYKLPILLFLRDHAQAIKETPDFSLVDALHDHLEKWEQSLPPEGWIKQQLIRGRCLMMLDGLDEVADSETRQMVVNWVERQMIAYHRNRFLVTSRPFGYRSNPLNGVTVLEIRPFTTEQVERFVYKWYLANEIMSKQKDDPGVHMRAKAEARGLLQQLRSTPNLFVLTTNPLLLTMIAIVHRYGGELPGNRVALFAEICEVFLGKRQKALGRPLELTPMQIQLILETLAYHLMLKGVREVSLDEVRTVIKQPLSRVSSQMAPETFLRLVENASGLLLEKENGVYSFAHLSFQEYLAATYIREKRLGDTLIAQIGDTWWQETIRLYCSMADATSILEACLAGDCPSTAAVALAIDCNKEAREIQPAVRARLEMLLKQGVEDSDTERQHVVAGALLAQRLRGMMHLKDETYVDTSLITCAEYQIFLDEQRTRGQYFEPDHWTLYRFLPGQGNIPILGLRASDGEAFCTWLADRESGPWLYRLPKVGELDDEGIADTLPPDTGYWLQGGESFMWAKKVLVLPVSVRQEFEKETSSEARALVHHFAHTLKPVYTDNLTGILAPLLDQVHTQAHASAYVLDLRRTLDLSSLRIVDEARVSDLTRALAHALNRTRALDLTRTLDLAEARRSAIADAIALIYHPEMASPQKGFKQHFDRNRKQQADEVQRLIEHLLHVYINMAILGKRISGDFSACEGLLIVKERK